MRHRVSGRKLNRNASHREAMFRNMAASLIKTLAEDDEAEGAPKVPGRIITTVEKAKELRPRVEKLITLAKKAVAIEEEASELDTDAETGSEEWQRWVQAVAPATAMRRRAFAELRDPESVEILFSVLAERFADRNGGYTRVVKLGTRRLGDSGEQALIEFVGENDRVRRKKQGASLAVRETEQEEETTQEEAEAPEEAVEPSNESVEASEQTAGSADESETSGESESSKES